MAVRSSATSEDLKTASFAGQHDTYLWVRGEDEVLRHILKCWASLFTDRAIAYRSQIGWPHDKVTISVGVQKMVNAKCAGVMFTIDPVMGDENKMVVEGNWGWGESVVKGEVSPDHFLVDKQSSGILEKNVAPKLVCYQLVGDKVVCAPSSPEKQNQLCLTDEELAEIVRLGKISEAHYQSAQDLEGVFLYVFVLIFWMRIRHLHYQHHNDIVSQHKSSLFILQIVINKIGQPL